MNIYPDEETTGLHSGWDITGTDTGAAAVTDRVTGNMENISEEEPEGTDDVPDTMEDIPGAEENNEENAENDGVNAEEAGTTSDNSDYKHNLIKVGIKCKEDFYEVFVLCIGIRPLIGKR